MAVHDDPTWKPQEALETIQDKKRPGIQMSGVN